MTSLPLFAEQATHIPDYSRGPLREYTGGTLRPGGLALTDRLVALAGCRAGGLLADIACGCGKSAAHLREKHGLKAVGLDISLPLLREATTPVCRGDAICLPFGSGCLDALLCECALSLMPDPEDVLREARRVLKPGCAFMVSDVYAQNFSGKNSAPPCSCVQGALDRRDLKALFARHSLRLETWEDHTPHLTQLAAELVFAHGSLRAFWETLLPPAKACETATLGARRKLGYYLAVFRRD